MRFTVAAVLAFASAVFAQDPTDGFDVLSNPTDGQEIPAGETYEIVWEPTEAYGDKPVSIVLIGGADQDHQFILDTIAEGIPSSDGSFSWEVAEDLGEAAVYGLKLILEEDTTVFQYSFPFSIKADDSHHGHSSSAAPSSSSASVTSAASISGYPVSSTSSTFVSSYSVSSNLSSTVSVPTSTSTGFSSASSTADASSSATSAAATGAAGAYAVNGLGLVGGLAMAVLAF